MEKGALLADTPMWISIAAAVIRRLPAGRYRCANLLGRHCKQAFRARMPEHLGGLWFSCDLRDSIARDVCFTGCYEPQETAAMLALLRPGMTYVDVGANWGYFTLLAAHLVGVMGRVFGLEPDPRLYRIVSENLRLNELQDRASVLPIAAAHEAGEMSLTGYDEGSGNWGLSRLTHIEAGQLGRQFTVKADQLDRILDDQQISRVNLLKMDIEGAELCALQGMERGLRDARYDRILLELHPAFLAEQGRTVEEVSAVLVAAGYQGWRLDHSPAACRRAAYARQWRLTDYLQPMEPGQAIDAWPHTLWFRPGLNLV